MGSWAKIKFYYDNLMGQAGSLLLASSTASGYSVENLYDTLESTQWMAAVTAGPHNITLDTNGAARNFADYFVIAGHNLGTVNGAVALQYSDDKTEWFDCFTPVALRNDKTLLKEFDVRTSKSAEFVRTQDLKAGGDGAKSAGWNLLNSANADSIDINTTNPGKLTVDVNALSSIITGPTFTAPFIYKNVTGDFEVETFISGHNIDEPYESGWITARDPNASAGEDSLGIAMMWQTPYSALTAFWRNIANSVDITQGVVVAVHPYLKMTRVGSLFTLFTKANAADVWTQRASYVRADFGTTIQVGLAVASYNVTNTLVLQFDYFRVTESKTNYTFWRVSITDTVAAPMMAICSFGRATELKYSSTNYDPHEKDRKAEVHIGTTGVVLGIYKKYNERSIAFTFKNTSLGQGTIRLADGTHLADGTQVAAGFDTVTIFNKILNWAESSGLKNFFIAHDILNHPEAVYLMRPEGAFSNSYGINGLYRDINIKLKGREE